MSAYFVGVTLFVKPVQALAAIGSLLVGWPFYFAFSTRKKRAAGRPA
jgi:hypothetical protein